jgi:hypothetical protein
METTNGNAIPGGDGISGDRQGDGVSKVTGDRNHGWTIESTGPLHVNIPPAVVECPNRGQIFTIHCQGCSMKMRYKILIGVVLFIMTVHVIESTIRLVEHIQGFRSAEARP